MARYTPILKSRQGEHWALRSLPFPELRAAPPLMELTASSKGVDPAKLGKALRDLPSDAVLAIDGIQGGPSALEDIDAAMSLRHERLVHVRDHPAMVPVTRVHDDARARASVRALAATHGHGVMLRVGTPERDPDPDEAEERLPGLLADVDADVSQVDLLIDMWAVGSQRDLERCRPVAVGMLHWAQSRPWRTVTLASGAFPSQITDLPQKTSTPLPRYDALLWRTAVKEMGSDADVGFGDYAIAHPQHSSGGGGLPSPSLRYTRAAATASLGLPNTATRRFASSASRSSPTRTGSARSSPGVTRRSRGAPPATAAPATPRSGARGGRRTTWPWSTAS